MYISGVLSSGVRGTNCEVVGGLQGRRGSGKRGRDGGGSGRSRAGYFRHRWRCVGETKGFWKEWMLIELAMAEQKEEGFAVVGDE